MILRNVKSRMKQYGLFGKACFTCRDPRWYNGSNKHTDQLACNIGLYRAGVIPDSARVQARQNACWNQSLRSYVCSRFTPSWSPCCGGTTPLLAVGGISGESAKSAVFPVALADFALPHVIHATPGQHHLLPGDAVGRLGLRCSGRTAQRVAGGGQNRVAFIYHPPAVTITTCRFGPAAGGLCAEMTGCMNPLHILICIDSWCHAECQ